MERGKKIETAITQLLGSVCCLHRNKMERGTIHKKNGRNCSKYGRKEVAYIKNYSSKLLQTKDPKIYSFKSIETKRVLRKQPE
jgi:hypothetical protein